MKDELQAFVYERVVRYAQDDRPDPSLILNDDVTKAAAELWRSAIQASPHGTVPYEIVEMLALFHWNRYCALPAGSDQDDLQVAAVMFGHIFRIAPESVPGQLLEVLPNEGAMEIQDNYGMPALASPSAVLRTYPEALDLGFATGPDWQIRQASAILRRVTRGDGVADLDRAISLLRGVVRAVPHDDPSRPGALYHLSEALALRSTRTGDPADQDQAVDVARAAAAEYPANPGLQNRLAVTVGERGRDRGDLSDLDDSVVASGSAVEMVATDDPNYVALLANLAQSLGNRYDRSNNPADLEASIEAYQAAADAAPDDHPARPRILKMVNRGRQLQSNRAGVRLNELGDVEGAKAAY